MFIMFPRAQSLNKEVTVYFRDLAACKIIRSWSISSYNITHLQPAVPSSPSLPLANALLLDASSSSTMSWGLTVICTTFAASALNLQSTGRRVRMLYKGRKIFNEMRRTYPLMASCHPTTAQSKSIVCCWDCWAVLPILPSTPAGSIPSTYTR